MNFLQFFVWGSWLISLGAYMIVTLGFTGGEVGSIYATMGVASLFMPVWAGKLLAIGASFAVNFSLSHFVVFKRR